MRPGTVVVNPNTLPRTALWGTQWGQMNGQSVPPAFAQAARLAGFTSVFPIPCNKVPPLRGGFPGATLRTRSGVQDSYLVDSASSHMLVSKIKPCMSKYKQSIP